MAKRKTPGTPGMGNRELYDAMFARRLSNAATPHDARPNRQRTRATAKKHAINQSW